MAEDYQQISKVRDYISKCTVSCMFPSMIYTGKHFENDTERALSQNSSHVRRPVCGSRSKGDKKMFFAKYAHEDRSACGLGEGEPLSTPVCSRVRIYPNQASLYSILGSTTLLHRWGERNMLN